MIGTAVSDGTPASVASQITAATTVIVQTTATTLTTSGFPFIKPPTDVTHSSQSAIQRTCSSSDARHYDWPKNGNSRRISSAVGRRPYSEISNASAYCTASPRGEP